MVITYVAGEFAGKYYRRARQAFNQWHAEWIGTDWQHATLCESTAQTQMPNQQQPQPIAPAIHPLAQLHDEIYDSHSVKQLAAVFGVRKARTKAQQVASLLAR